MNCGFIVHGHSKKIVLLRYIGSISPDLQPFNLIIYIHYAYKCALCDAMKRLISIILCDQNITLCLNAKLSFTYIMFFVGLV